MANLTSVDIRGQGDHYRIFAVGNHYAVERNGLLVGVVEPYQPGGWRFAPLDGNSFYSESAADCLKEAKRYASQ